MRKNDPIRFQHMLDAIEEAMSFAKNTQWMLMIPIFKFPQNLTRISYRNAPNGHNDLNTPNEPA
jgi:hypothetical protein